MTFKRRFITFTAIAIGCAGCFGNRPIPNAKKIVSLPKKYETPQNVTAPMLDNWCSDFGDAQLNTLIKDAFSKNLNMRIAWVRLEQAKTQARQVDSGLYPTLNAQAQVSQQRAAINTPQGLVTIEGQNYRPSLVAGYEVDLWGKLAAQRQAAKFDVKASRADLEAIALSMTSEVAEAWFDVLQQRQKRTLLEKQIKINQRYVELLLLRLRIAQASALDINQQEQQIDTLKTQLIVAKSGEKLAMMQLASLVGKSVQKFKISSKATTLPEVPAMPGLGVPADLLERRPDVRAAQLRLKASNKRIAVAVRSRLPSLTLSASMFLQANVLSELLDALLWNIAAQAAAPLVDGGRLGAEVTLAELRQNEAVLNYANVMLRALTDVERAMVQEDVQVKTIKQLDAQKLKAEQALELVQSRFQRGLVDYLRVLTTIQSLQRLEQNLIDARRRQLSNRVSLCRALGGTWTKKLKAPKKHQNTSNTKGKK